MDFETVTLAAPAERFPSLVQAVLEKRLPEWRARDLELEMAGKLRTHRPKGGRRKAGQIAPHGTSTRYRRGCRCAECSEVNSERSRTWKKFPTHEASTRCREDCPCAPSASVNADRSLTWKKFRPEQLPLLSMRESIAPRRDLAAVREVLR